MHKIRIVGITVFSVLLFGCTVVSFVHPQREYSDRENRYLEMKPEISPGDILSGDYQEHYETYLTDQIFLRDFWVKLAVQMELLTGKREINSVYIGKNGYLLEAYGDTDFDPVQAEANIGVLAGFLNEAVQVYGKQNVTCMMLPSKANAMPDQLPDYAALNEEASVVEGLGMALEEPEILLDVGPSCAAIRTNTSITGQTITGQRWGLITHTAHGRTGPGAMRGRRRIITGRWFFPISAERPTIKCILTCRRIVWNYSTAAGRRTSGL